MTQSWKWQKPAGPRIGDRADFTTESCQTFQELNRFMNCVCLLYKQNMSGISLFGDMLTEVNTHQKSHVWKLKEPGNPRISNVGCDLLWLSPFHSAPVPLLHYRDMGMGQNQTVQSRYNTKKLLNGCSSPKIWHDQFVGNPSSKSPKPIYKSALNRTIFQEETPMLTHRPHPNTRLRLSPPSVINPRLLRVHFALITYIPMWPRWSWTITGNPWPKSAIFRNSKD